MDEATAYHLDVRDEIEDAESRDDLMGVIGALNEGYTERYFEERPLTEYLDGIEGFVRNLDKWAEERGLPAPEQPSWQWIARIFYGAFGDVQDAKGVVGRSPVYAHRSRTSDRRRGASVIDLAEVRNAIGEIETRRDLLSVIDALTAAYRDGKFEEQSINDYLDGLWGIVHGLEGWCKNFHHPVPEQPTWRWLGRFLYIGFTHS